jgi:acetoacetyl-CoA reductase
MACKFSDKLVKIRYINGHDVVIDEIQTMTQKIALVTGGTRGIGAGISLALKAAGYTVAANYATNHEAAQAFSNDTGISVYSWDVADFASCQDGVRRVTQDLGDISVLINNAGITRDMMFHKMPPEAWSAVIGTNLTSCYNLCSLIYPGMRERGYGRIVNISSVNAQLGQLGQVNYSAAKAGIIGLTRALAFEGAAKGVLVNAIAPGYINTDMVAAIPEAVKQKIIAQIPVGHLGEVSDVARTVLFLVSEDNQFLTGTTINVNGGQNRV